MREASVSALEPPNLSEVIRRLDELREDLKGLGGKFVSAEIYMIDKQAADRDMREAHDRIRAIQQASDAADKKAITDQSAKDVRAQEQAATNRKFLIGIAVSPFASAVVAWIISGGLRP